MTISSVCVHVDFNPRNPGYLRARCYQFDANKQVWGRSINHPNTRVPHDVKRAVEMAFRGKVRWVWIDYDVSIGLVPEVIVFEPLTDADYLVLPVSA